MLTYFTLLTCCWLVHIRTTEMWRRSTLRIMYIYAGSLPRSALPTDARTQQAHVYTTRRGTAMRTDKKRPDVSQSSSSVTPHH
jgi:hypothetical protein